jgi:hypothetical protein
VVGIVARLPGRDVGVSRHGSVIAGESWAAPMQRMPLPAAPGGRGQAPRHDAVPDAETWGHYVPTLLGRRCDVFCRCDESRALPPLYGTVPVGAEREAYPHGG